MLGGGGLGKDLIFLAPPSQKATGEWLRAGMVGEGGPESVGDPEGGGAETAGEVREGALGTRRTCPRLGLGEHAHTTFMLWMGKLRFREEG